MKSYKSLLFIAAVIALLAVVVALFPKEGILMGSKSLHFPTFRQVMVPKEQLDLEAYLQEQAERKAQRLTSLNDSIAFYSREADSSDIRFWFPNNDNTYFDTLFAAMEQATPQGRYLRVLHYGDSQIEMDHITSRLRIFFQQRFGGGGPGMVQAATIIGSPSVSVSGSGALTLQSSFGDSLAVRARGNYGPMVQCFHLSGSAVTSIRAANSNRTDEKLKQFSHVALIFNNRPGPLQVQFNGRTTQQNALEEAGVHRFDYQCDSLKSVRLRMSGNADLYGVMVDDGPGVCVDNIPMRGCSGQQFCGINQDQLAEAYALMDVGLIILQFGGNSVPYIRTEKQLQTYTESLRKQMQRLKTCCPGAKFLFIGPSDMSTTVGGVMQTYPFLPQFIEGLRDMVLQEGAAYWSIYHAMGGSNSMPVWVSKGYAGSDYLHFSQKGADIMGDRLADAFEMMYELYRIRKDYSQVNAETF